MQIQSFLRFDNLNNQFVNNLKKMDSMRIKDIEQDWMQNPMEIMAENLKLIHQQLTENSSDGQTKQNTSEDIVKVIEKQYSIYIKNSNFPNNHQEKLSILMEQTMSIGNCVALFEMVYYFREILSVDILIQISQKALSVLKKANTKTLIRVLIQLIALCGISDQEIINYFSESLIQQKYSFDQCFIVLVNAGFKGIQALLIISNQDFKDISLKILDYLSRSEAMVQNIIIPYLLADLAQGNIKQRVIALAALNRLNSLVGYDDRVQQVLIQLLEQSSVDSILLISVLRSSGMQGEKQLLSLLKKYSNIQKIALPIISILPWKPPIDPILRLKTIEYSVGRGFLPGTLYQYEGSIEPSAFNYTDTDCCDSLCLNSRDFLSSLNRIINQQFQDHFSQDNARKGTLNNKILFVLKEILQPNQEIAQIEISSDVIKSLSMCLSNQNSNIRQAALNALGTIKQFDNLEETLSKITKCLWDSDSKNRSMACWALSKLCFNPSPKLINRLVELLKDNFWKVRTSACISLGTILRNGDQIAIEGLVRVLKDGSINKCTVCEALMNLGQLGCQVLLQILRTTAHNDFKLKEAILNSFKLVNVKCHSINLMIEQIFRHCKDSRIQTRALCLETLNTLRIKFANQSEDLTFLQGKNILPLYYFFLEDPSPRIRQLASQSILSFGSQAELIFIEGLTRGTSLVRIQSAKCLAKLGPQNFRALILGIKDQDHKVRTAAANAILEHFHTHDIIQYYAKKPNQKASLLCSLNDVISDSQTKREIRRFIRQVIIGMQKHQ